MVGGRSLEILILLFAELLGGRHGLVATQHPDVTVDAVALDRFGPGCRTCDGLASIGNTLVFECGDHYVPNLLVAARARVEHADGVGEDGLGLGVIARGVGKGVDEVFVGVESTFGAAMDGGLVGGHFFEEFLCGVLFRVVFRVVIEEVGFWVVWAGLFAVAESVCFEVGVVIDPKDALGFDFFDGGGEGGVEVEGEVVHGGSPFDGQFLLRQRVPAGLERNVIALGSLLVEELGVANYEDFEPVADGSTAAFVNDGFDQTVEVVLELLRGNDVVARLDDLFAILAPEFERKDASDDQVENTNIVTTHGDSHEIWCLTPDWTYTILPIVFGLIEQFMILDLVERIAAASDMLVFGRPGIECVLCNVRVGIGKPEAPVLLVFWLRSSSNAGRVRVAHRGPFCDGAVSSLQELVDALDVWAVWVCRRLQEKASKGHERFTDHSV